MSKTDAPSDLILNGIDGGNLLGFLAAIGALRIVTEYDPQCEWKLGWRDYNGIWSPVLSGNEALTQGGLIETLAIALEAIGNNPAFEIANNLSVEPDKFRGDAENAQQEATIANRRYADFIAAFGCESLTSPDKKKIQDTAIRAAGTGKQTFLGSIRTLLKETSAEHLKTALFEQWQYSDGKPSLRWDPFDDRRYALRWGNPSNDSKSPIKTVRGANRLAVEALPLLPTMPTNEKLRTTGFAETRRMDPTFTWPIWESSVGLDVVRSLLSFPELQELHPNHSRIRKLGIVQVYRSRRIRNGDYRNFTPAIQV